MIGRSATDTVAQRTAAARLDNGVQYPSHNFRLSSALKARISRYTKRHLVPAGRIIRRLLSLPWDKDDTEIVCLPIPKAVSRNPEKLAAWLNECCEEVKQHYSSTT